MWLNNPDNEETGDFMYLDRLKALTLLTECTGDDLWSVEYCRHKGVPEHWIEELNDCFESGFNSDSQTIYVEERVTNQYHGIRDVDLATRLGEYLGLDVASLQGRVVSRRQLVRAILEAAEED
ncbi:MAG: hypothetical protein KDB03_01820 [Planctomycetales bacterium]|nr:hypothetical protein [Planctomycetales bacterium]